MLLVIDFDSEKLFSDVLENSSKKLGPTAVDSLDIDISGTLPTAVLPDGSLRSLLSSAFNALLPGGELRVSFAAKTLFNQILQEDAILCGFVTDPTTGILKRPAFAAVSKLKTRLPSATLLEGKSSIESSSSSLSSSSLLKVTHVSPVSIINSSSSTWTIAAKNLNSNTDLIDEESLLLDNASANAFSTLSLSKSTAEKAALETESCAPKKRACKNCSCGRKEMEEAEESIVKFDDITDGISNSSKLSSNSIPSACGNCSKGDAFRCATCPSRGKPAWKADATTGNVMIDMASDL